MERKVVVLSPSEWENRIELGKAMELAYRHSHFAVRKESTLQAILYSLSYSLVNDRKDKDELLAKIEDAVRIGNDMLSEIRKSQEYIGNISSMIGYKVNQEIYGDKSDSEEVK